MTSSPSGTARLPPGRKSRCTSITISASPGASLIIGCPDSRESALESGLVACIASEDFGHRLFFANRQYRTGRITYHPFSGAPQENVTHPGVATGRQHD